MSAATLALSQHHFQTLLSPFLLCKQGPSFPRKGCYTIPGDEVCEMF